MPSAKPKLGAKYVVLSGTFPHLEERNGLDAGKAALKGIIASHGGIVDAKVQGRTNLLVIGNHPGRTKVRDAEHRAIQIIHIFMLEMYLEGIMTFKELIGTAPPEITKSAGFSPNPPPEAQEASPT
jgi:NAD-dependent DNA ligase